MNLMFHFGDIGNRDIGSKQMLFLTLFLSFSMIAAQSDMNMNVTGGTLQQCSQIGEANTGFTRNGQCADINGDIGTHHICYNINAADNNDSNFCQETGQPDWCSEEDACTPGSTEETCPRVHWCVCQWAFRGFLGSVIGGCDAVKVNIQCDATNCEAVKAYRDANDQASQNALACIKQKCGDLSGCLGNTSTTQTTTGG
eukprot:g5375.t1